MVADNELSAIMAMADLSTSNGDYERGLLLLRNALGLLEKAPSTNVRQRLEIMMKLAEINHVTGQWVDALMYLDNAFQTASEKSLLPVMAEALLTSGTILSKKGKWDLAQRKFDQTISIIGPDNAGPLMARALIGKGIISWRIGSSKDAMLLARKALSMDGALNDDNIVGSAYALTSSAAFDMGDYSLSLNSNDRALAHFRKANNAIEVVRVLNNTGETHKVMGDYAKALEFFEQGLEASTGGSPRNAGYLLTNIAECHARQGNNIDARTYAHMAGEKVEKLQDEYLDVMLEFVWAMIHEIEKDQGKASGHYVSAIRKMQGLGIPFDTGIIQLSYGKFLSAQEKKDAAVLVLGDAIASFKKSGSVVMTEAAEKVLAGLSA